MQLKFLLILTISCVLHADTINIPYSIGRVTKTYNGSTDKLVINIQDLHCHPQVQRNIEKILEILDRKYNIESVYVEGATGVVDTSWLFDNDNKEVVEALINQGRLTGIEYYAIKSKKPNLIEGVEDKQLYDANLLRLKSIINIQPQIKILLSDMQETVNNLKIEFYNNKHLRFDKFITNYRNGNLKVGKHVAILKKYAARLNIDLAAYKNFELYINKMIQEINPIDLVSEENKLIKEIDNKLSQNISEKEITFIANFTDYLKRYLEGKISNDDYNYYTANLPDYCLLLSKYIDTDILSDINSYSQLLDDYYRTNIERTNHFLENIKRLQEAGSRRLEVKTLTSSSERPASGTMIPESSEIIVIITGGFHTKGMEELLIKKDISYVIITPTITQSTKFSEEVYNELISE